MILEEEAERDQTIIAASNQSVFQGTWCNETLKYFPSDMIIILICQRQQVLYIAQVICNAHAHIILFRGLLYWMESVA